MDALLLTLNKMHEAGFVGTASVSYTDHAIGIDDNWKVVSQEMSETKTHYVAQLQHPDGRTLQQAFSLDGGYIGSLETADRLVEGYGIIPERVADEKVCNVGFSERDQVWYGWSHIDIKPFPTRYEAHDFAKDCSRSTYEEAGNGFLDYGEQVPEIFAGLSAERKQNPKTYRWYRYDHPTKMRFKEKMGNTLILEKGDIIGLKWNARSKEVYIASNEDLGIAFETDLKRADQLFKRCKPFRGKVAGEAVGTDKNDWLTERDRAKLAPAPAPKQPRQPKPANKAPKLTPASKSDIKKHRLNAYFWTKVEDGKGIPRITTEDQGETVTLTLDKGEVFGLMYDAESNACIVVPEEDTSLIFVVSPQVYRKILKGVKHWRGTVSGVTGQRLTPTAFLAHRDFIASREFAKVYKAGGSTGSDAKDVDVEATTRPSPEERLKARVERDAKRISKADDAIYDSIDHADEGGDFVTKKEQKSIEKAIKSGEEVWFAAGVTNLSGNKANVVFDRSKNAAIKKLKPLMFKNSGDTITYGRLAASHPMYRQYLARIDERNKETGRNQTEIRAGIKIASARIAVLARDGVSGTVGTTKSGTVTPTEQEVQVPDFNENYRPHGELAPVFRSNSVEVLKEISNAIRTDKAYTAAYIPFPKLRETASGQPTLLLEAKFNNDRYIAEGKRALRRMQTMYGSRAIQGRFKVLQKEGQAARLFLVIAIAKATTEQNGKAVPVSDEVEARAVKIRRFMTGMDEDKFVERDKLVVRESDLRNQISRLTDGIDQANMRIADLDEEIKKLRITINESVKGTTDYIENQVDELKERKQQISSRRNAALAQVGKLKAEVEDAKRSMRSSNRVANSIFQTKDGDQVRVIAPNYKNATIKVTPIRGDKNHWDKVLEVTELYDLGGKQVL